MIKPPAPDAPAQADALLGMLKERSPEAAELALLLSLAARIEPSLLRAARLEANLPAAAEADLWFSGIVSARSPNLGVSFVPDVAEALRQELAASPAKREMAWQLLCDHHGHQPWSIRLEEQINYLVTDLAAPASKTDELLAAALRELKEVRTRDERAAVGIARWLLAALMRIPPTAQATPTAAAAYLAAGVHLDGRAAGIDRLSRAERSELLPWLLDQLGTTTVQVRLLPGAVAIGRTGGVPFPVPTTHPLVISVAWGAEPNRHLEHLRMAIGEERSLPVESPEVELRTLTGGGLLLSRAGLGRITIDGRFQGAAFAVEAHLILTAAHVIGDIAAAVGSADESSQEPTIRYLPDDGEPLAARVVAVDHDLDAALLELTQPAPAILPIGQIQTGARWRLQVMPYPERASGELAESRQSIGGQIGIGPDDLSGSRFELADRDVDLAGQSGGAVMLENPWGAVVGVLVGVKGGSPGGSSLIVAPISKIIAEFRVAGRVKFASAGLASGAWATAPPLGDLLDLPLSNGTLPTLRNVAPAELDLPAAPIMTAVSNQAFSQLRLALVPPAFVVVSGATEVAPLTAYLAAADTLPDAALLVPKPGPGILANLAAHPAVFGFGGRMVVWLRDLPRYLSDDGGPDLMVLSRFLGRSQPAVVLATISDVDLEALHSRTPGPPDATRALLDQAVLIPVPAAAAPAPEDATPTAARPAPLAAFLSYVRSDDENDNGQITMFRERLDEELQLLTGENFATFQDRNDIAWGQNWSERIDEALNAATVLIVIITPSIFRSAACRAEIERFRERERALGRGDLIRPVYYISSPEMDDPQLWENDDVVMTLRSHKWLDWRELRFQSFDSRAARQAVNALATSIVDTARRPSPPRPADTAGSSADSSSPRTAGLATAEESGVVGAAGASVFISYNYRDRAWLDRLLQQLDLLLPTGNIAAFSDRDVRRAASGTNDMLAAIDAARVAIMLVSPDYLASDVVNEELPYLLARAESKRLIIIPVILKPSLFEETPLSQFQAANPPGKPLSVMPRTEAERALVDIAGEIDRLINQSA